jgi:hypothetical protein
VAETIVEQVAAVLDPHLPGVLGGELAKALAEQIVAQVRAYDQRAKVREWDAEHLGPRSRTGGVGGP